MAHYPLNPETMERVRRVVAVAGYEFDGVQESFDRSRLPEIIFQTTQDRYIFSVPFDSENFDDVQLLKKIQHAVEKYRRNKENKMTDTPRMNLRQKLVEVYKRVDHVDKAGRNDKQKYDFVRAADVLRAIRKAFADLGIYAETNYDTLGSYDIKTNSGGTMHTAMVKATIKLYDTDSDETKTISGLGDGADSGDKGVYKAQTGATKNALRNGTLLPDEADPEADTRVDDSVAEQNYPHIYSSDPIPASDHHQVQFFDAGGPPNVHPAPTPQKPPDTAHEVQLPAPVVQGDAYEPPVDHIPPTEEQLAQYRTKFRALGDELSANGKLTASRGLPVARKLLVFLLSITKAADANSISGVQWDDFFARAEAIKVKENGLIALANQVNKANGIEPKEK